MNWKNVRLIFMREIRDQLRDRRTLFMITILPVLLYPMLGLGMVQMMLTFSEQRQTVVVLNADQLPESLPFLDEEGIRSDWLGSNQTKKESSALQILTDAQPLPTEEAEEGANNRRRKSPQEMLANAQRLADKVQEYKQAKAEDTDDLTMVHDQLRLSFYESGIQLLVIVPEGYADSIAQLRKEAANSTSQDSAAINAADLPPLQIVRNNGDDKSLVAYGRVHSALDRWENALRAGIFADANLRPDLQHPARLQVVEAARQEFQAANVWSKLFPAMIVVMALTGAFYPAIDLGAGEKERGTMETLLISPARRIELVMGKFFTILMFSIGTALMNLLSMGMTGSHLASALTTGVQDAVSLEMPGIGSMLWMLLLLIPLAALFSALCLALATFAKSTKEGQYYLTPLLMVIIGLTMFCLQPGIEMTPFYSVIPIVNVALLLKGMLLATPQSNELLGYVLPVLISSFGYSMLALTWAIDLYNSENVLFREAEKFDLRNWLKNLTRDKEPVPHQVHAILCFVMIMFLQYIGMTMLSPDPDAPARKLMLFVVVQQLTVIAIPAVFLGLLLTTSWRATFRFRAPSLAAMTAALVLPFLVHPISVELGTFMVQQGFLPAPSVEVGKLMAGFKQEPLWLALAVMAVTPAICEELAFRGFILSGLARGGRLGIAVLFSSMMFGMMHLIPQQVFNAGLVGIVLGLLAINSRSLWPVIAFHFLNNTLAVLHGRIDLAKLPDYVDGTFFVVGKQGLRYGAPLVIVCSIAVGLICTWLIRSVQAESTAREKARLDSFEAAPSAV